MTRINISVNEETTINRTVESDFSVGIVLESPRGAVESPSKIASESELALLFGESTVQYPVLSFIRTYLRKYSGVYISRIKYQDAVASKATISNTEGATVFTLVGNSFSDFENDHIVTVSKNASTNLITIAISDTNGIVRSTINNLPNNFQDLVIEYNSKSQYYTMELASTATGELDLTQSTKFAGGVKGSRYDKEDIISAIKSFDTVNIPRLDAICAPGLNIDASVVTAGVDTAKSRRETIYLADVPENTSYEDMLTVVATYPRSDSAAIYYPSHLAQVPTGATNSSKLVVPASALALFAYAIAAKTSRWTTPAGYNSDFRLNNIIKSSVDLSSEQADAMYEATEDRPAVNPIVYDNTIGYLVDGQRTTAESSSLMYPLNVSKLTKHVYYIVKEGSKGFRYKPNTQFTWDEWTLSMNTKLTNIRNSDGIDEYEVDMGINTMTDDEISSGIMRGIIRIKPTFVADYITINIGLTTEDIIIDTNNAPVAFQ